MTAQLSPASPLAARFATGWTDAVEALMDPTDPADPIARQYVPDTAELDDAPGESPDPIGDRPHSPVEGIVHRHGDRVLLKPVHVCPVYCRFCFRKAMVGPGGEGTLSAAALDRALGYVAGHPEIAEVIVTGGDPFMLSAARARALSEKLGSIPHLQFVRWHTRMPVADPERVTDDYVAALQAGGKPTWVAVHVNHPRELSDLARAALARLIDGGVPVVSQSVLLAGVNDDVETLIDLFRSLTALRVKPYYLHHLDRAPGTAHFRVSLERGREIARALRSRLSGLAQPTYVLDIPGGAGKALAAEGQVERDGDAWRAQGSDGVWREYREDRA
jgi:lysine 2,3-aminomutase